MVLSVSLTDADFEPLAGFWLSWRWTDPKWSVLPDTALSRIRPVSDRKVTEIWGALRVLLGGERLAFNPQHFSTVRETNTSDAGNQVGEWIRGLIPSGSEDVLIIWSSSRGVLTTVDVFCDYWEDFCYPGSDDVLVWPLSDAWAAVYEHLEVMSLGLRRH